LDAQGSAEEHVGFGGRAFTAYKFRTSPNDGARNLSDDPTPATCLNSVLRDSGLDRLPQLISILRGDMSFVGPRPIRLDSSDHAGPDYFAARPGLLARKARPGRDSSFAVVEAQLSPAKGPPSRAMPTGGAGVQAQEPKVLGGQPINDLKREFSGVFTVSSASARKLRCRAVLATISEYLRNVIDRANEATDFVPVDQK
jgi:hypothetical protein